MAVWAPGTPAVADHLYVQTAAQGWLRGQGHTPRHRCINRDDAPVGSLVARELSGHTLLLHMDRTMPPDWDAEEAGDLVRAGVGSLLRRLGDDPAVERHWLGR
ncbi:hypothetical protein [Streptomyces sp. NPDC057496]|uniref:hypothetical protein n=1 Tax=Streptomyces sp. NPDC057496 TaxID=3346149 RepID=UPI0036ADE86D